jgi:hypothetical protein
MTTYDKALYDVTPGGYKYRLPPSEVKTDPASNGRVASVSTEGFTAIDKGPLEGNSLIITGGEGTQ